MVALLVAPLLTLPAAGQGLKPPKKSSRGKAPRIEHLKDVEKGILRLTNEARRKDHLPPLDKDEALTATARAHSDDMLQRHFFSHENPDGQTPKDRLAPATVATASKAGENIWSGSGHDPFDTKLMARMIVDSWLTSPGHRANILNPDYTHLGVGVSTQGGREIRATQLFVTRCR
jgi:uncharacterized protein YkwD